MPIGLGCMRLSTDADRDPDRALATLSAALDGGVTVLDTAHAYGLGADEMGHNERLIRQAVGNRVGVRVITKCGMSRPEGAWLPDGRAKAIMEHAEASAEALGRPPDVLLLHAPDPRVPLERSIRALALAQERGLATTIGLSNIHLHQLQEARQLAPIAAVEIALGFSDDSAVAGGLARSCLDEGIELLAHSPLGGVRRAARLAEHPELKRIGLELAATAAEVFLAYLLRLDPRLTPLPGARRPQTASSVARVPTLVLSDHQIQALDACFPGLSELGAPCITERYAGPPPGSLPLSGQAEVVMIVGVPGSGKSTLAQSYAERGYLRLNRDERGGSLKDIARALDEALLGGAQRVVLDNTYLSRASRHEVIGKAKRRGARVHGVFCAISKADAQLNLAERALAGGHEVAPTSFFRMLRQLEPPSPDEGFDRLETTTFDRSHPTRGGGGLMVSLDAVDGDLGSLTRAFDRLDPRDPVLIFTWRPEAEVRWTEQENLRARQLAARWERPVDFAVCIHPGGPPRCWCRPPLPGLWVAFARRHQLDARRSWMMGTSTAHATLARAAGLRLVIES